MESLCDDIREIILSFALEHVTMTAMRQHPNIFLLWSKIISPDITLELEIHSKEYNADIFLTTSLKPRGKYKSEVFYFNVKQTQRWKLLRFDNILNDFWGKEEFPVTFSKGMFLNDTVDQRVIHVLNWDKTLKLTVPKFSKTQMASF